MTIRVQDSDGTIIEFPDGTPHETIAGVMRQRDGQRAPQPPRNRPRSSNPTGSRPGANTISADNAAYSQARIQRVQERAPRFAPGTPGRALEDFNRNGPAGMMEQLWRNVGIADDVAGIGTYLGQGAENLVRQARGQRIEIPASEAANAAYDYERDQQQRVASDQPALNTASIVASIPAMGGNPASGVTRVGALEAGLGAMGVNAPFAVARQDGTLPQRLPGALMEEAGVGAFSAGITGLVNRLTRPPRLQSGRGRVQQFDDAGVRPTQAAVSGGTPAAMTRMISENFLAGAPARSRLAASLDDTAESAGRIARGYASNRSSNEAAGETLQGGLRRFAQGEGAGASRPAGSVRNWSFDQRADAIYEHVFDKVRRAEAGWRARGQQPPVTADATRIVLDDVLGRNSPDVAGFVNDGNRLTQFRQLLGGRGNQSAGAQLTLQDIRDLRTYVRQQRRVDPAQRPTLSDANLARLESALTEDISATTRFIAGDRVARELRQADRYYRTGNERIQTALSRFLGARVTPAQAYEQLVRLASEGGSQNTAALLSVRQSLQPEEWRQIASTVIDRMGRVRPGAANALEDGAFSVENFVTNYARLTPNGRRALFGELGSPTGANGNFINLEHALDNLAQVAGYQKGVEQMVNRSRSGVNVQNFGSVAGLANPATTLPTAGLLGGMAITGEMLTNPAFVRWLAGVSNGNMRQHIAMLGTIARSDPAIAPLYRQLAERVLGDSQQPEEIGSARQ